MAITQVHVRSGERTVLFTTADLDLRQDATHAEIYRKVADQLGEERTAFERSHSVQVEGDAALVRPNVIYG